MNNVIVTNPKTRLYKVLNIANYSKKEFIKIVSFYNRIEWEIKLERVNNG